MATILHCIDSAFRGVEIPEIISVETVRAAIKWVGYTTSQALSINLELCDSTALAPNLDKIISLAKRREGTVSARDAQNSFDHKLKITSQQVKEWFTQLEAMKYGKVTTVKKSVLFTLATDNDATVVNCSHTVDKEKLQLESLQGKVLTPTVVTVVTDLPPSEKSDNQLVDLQNQSSTTPTVTTVGSNLEAEGMEADYSTQKPLTTVTTVSAQPERSVTNSRAAEPIVLADNPLEPDPPQSETEPATPTTGAKSEIKKGDRVVIARSDDSRYRGVKGEVITDCYGAKGLEFYIRFDKKISNILHHYFPATDVMREPC
ncbi:MULTISPECIES: hypothetical protein [unclassified Microcoleus]|uniref:hypothetical protein n=1 Tax=unclassified Microcoleus TaxID=2642155 RepID=UPI002FD0D1DC